MEKPEKQSFTHAVSVVDYKDTDLLRRFINPNGRILARRITGTSSRNQRKIANAIKRARFMGLLPYIER